MNDTPQSLEVVQVAPQTLDRLRLDELHDGLEYVKQVMMREMKEGQDYGKIPGCGDKPGLFQPGAQKLLLAFQLTPHVKKEVLRELPHPSIFGHREYEFTICVQSKTGREWDGVGTCSTFESKYRYRKSSRKCPQCGKETILKSKNAGEGWFCWRKKGGCGATFALNDATITGQEEGKSDNENPAEFWNTVRKMAFKRAIVHASINATNTSELWSQDLEDLPQAHSAKAEYVPEDDNVPFEASAPVQPKQTPPAPQSAPPKGNLATPQQRLKALNHLGAAPGGQNVVMMEDFLRSKLWISGNETVMDWPLQHVPATVKLMAALNEEVMRFGTLRREQNDPQREQEAHK